MQQQSPVDDLFAGGQLDGVGHEDAHDGAEEVLGSPGEQLLLLQVGGGGPGHLGDTTRNLAFQRCNSFKIRVSRVNI